MPPAVALPGTEPTWILTRLSRGRRLVRCGRFAHLRSPARLCPGPLRGGCFDLIFSTDPEPPSASSAPRHGWQRRAKQQRDRPPSCASAGHPTRVRTRRASGRSRFGATLGERWRLRPFTTYGAVSRKRR